MTKKKTNRYVMYGFLIIIGVIFALTFLSLTRPFPAGGVTTTYAKVALIYLNLVKTRGDYLPVKDQINHSDPLTKLDAIFEIKKSKKDTEKVQILLDFLKSPDNHPDLKDNAIWALGELKAKEALDVLESLKIDNRISQYELKKAILKIRGEYSWDKRIANQFK
jgi:hypothetical protein